MLKHNSLVVACAVLVAGMGLSALRAQSTQPAGDQKQHKTPGGVTYVVTRQGEGAKVGDAIFVHYTGKLTDGTKFDSSYDDDQPLNLILGAGRVIRGWEEGLQGMHVGEKRTLTIPPELAYGAEGRPPKIPPNSTLVFDVEMVGIQRK